MSRTRSEQVASASRGHPAEGHADLDIARRHAKARKIQWLLGLEANDRPVRLLEIGTGAGGIADYFANHSQVDCEVTAVDVRDTRQVTGGYDFQLVEGVALPFGDETFDVVISNHVIEHVGDTANQRGHLAELHRVMKPPGVGYLAVPNRWQVTEPHFRLAFLSWLPESLRTGYVRLRGRGEAYDCRPLTVSRLEALLAGAGFRFEQQTFQAIRAVYEIENPGSRLYRHALRRFRPSLYWKFRALLPTLIYVLRRN